MVKYLAYVTLAIPCSLENLANQLMPLLLPITAYENLEVPYTLTILNEGVTTTYEGISRPEEFGVDYPFQVGPAVIRIIRIQQFRKQTNLRIIWSCLILDCQNCRLTMLTI